MGIFSDHLKKNIERVLQEVNYKITWVAYQYFVRIVQNSPGVGNGMTPDGPYVTGCFSNNWFPAINAYDTSTSMSIATGGADSLLRIESIVKDSKALIGKDGFISLSNNLSYAQRVETLGWRAGLDPVSGWRWTGLRTAYHPIGNSYAYLKTIT